MVPAVPFFIVAGAGAVLGFAGIVLGIRKKEWAGSARAVAIVFGAVVLLPALYELLVIAYVANCTRAPSGCL